MAWSQRGTVIRGNRLHGAHGRTGGANGLYLDIDVDGVTCEHNLVYDIAQHALHVHMAKHNIIRNNTFICGPEGGISFMNSGACVFERNIVCGQQRGIQFADPDGARFTGNTYWTTAGAPRFEPALSFYNSQPFPHGHGEEVGHLAVLDPVPGIDTAPSAADWDRARTVDRFVNAHGNPPPAVHRHDVRFLRQGMLLHVRGRLERPPVAAPVRRPGPSVWGSEHFDLWLKPFGDRSGFVQLGVTADGETAALWSSNAPAHFGWRASVQLLAGRPGWEVTLCIPLDELAAVFGGGTLAPAFQVGFAVANPAVDFAGWQALGRDPDGIIADPLFVDPVGGDFRLRSD
jgi:hypothetical protein